MKIKSPTRWLAIALAVAGGLTLAGWAQAQDIYYWYYFLSTLATQQFAVP